MATRFTNTATGQVSFTSEQTAMILNTNSILYNGAVGALTVKGLWENREALDGTTDQVHAVRTFIKTLGRKSN